MGLVIGLVWLVIGYIVMETALLVWTALMLPNPVERARLRLTRRPAAHFFAGLLVVLVTVVAASVFFSDGAKGPLALIGWVLMGPMLAAGAVGGAAFARIAGERLREQTRGASEASALVGGALLTVLPGLLPVVGWFLYLPVISLISVGAGSLALIRRRSAAPVPAPPAPVWPASQDTPAPANAPQPWLGLSEQAGS